MGSLLSTPKATATEAQDNDKRNQITPKRRRRMSATGASSDGVAALRSAKRARTDSSSLAAEQTTRDPVNLSSNNATAPPVRRRKRKVALMLGYIGERYYGMQMNVGVLTIEKVLFDALRQAGAISDENKNSLGRVNWMRAARTDKGVSAASQCVSAKIHCEVNGQIDRRLVDQINSYLPEDVHLFGILRATSAFNARSDCHRRRYEYIFPLRLLGGKSTVEASEGSEPGDPRVAKLNEILAAYVGTHCFANFTEGLAGSDDSAKRYMIEVKCSQPFLPSGSGVYYVSICIFGQSFVLHQIRKMIGLALFVYLGRVSAKVIPVALSPHVRIPTPTAPSLGLLLDELYFDQYNTRHKSALPVPISMKCFAKEKFDFKLSKIYARIAEKERLNRTMENWIRSSLNRQKYDAEKVDELHKDFVLSDNGLEAQRKARIASLYPIVTNLESLASPQGSAWEVDTFQLANTMRTEFEARFGTPASFLVRAPGRVILIGEHVDYNDLPVIGVALSQSTLIAGCWDAAAKLEIEHFEANAFLKGSLHSDGARLADTVQAQENERGMDDKWLNYVSCGIKAMVSDLKLNKRTEPTGGRILVGGNLPRAFGLSSSSSLVTAAALSAARLNRKRVPKHSVTETAANGERLGAGTQGGAVDHALCMGGVKGSALYVSFNPKPSTIPLTLPTQVVFVVVNSNVVAEKGLQGGVALHYNTRVAECRIASAILARRLKTILPNVVQTVGQLLHMAMRTKGLKIESLSDLRERVAAVMAADEKMNVKDVLAEMKIPESEVRSRFLGHLPLEEFELGKRISHVLSEAERVERFKSILEGDTASDAVVDQIGQILDESHKSLKEKYQCSCDEVDAVVSFCKENGSSGSRVTGAGWGGCILSVVHMSKLEPFLNATRRRYGNSSVFAVSPASGASIFAIHSSYSNPRVS